MANIIFEKINFFSAPSGGADTAIINNFKNSKTDIILLKNPILYKTRNYTNPSSYAQFVMLAPKKISTQTLNTNLYTSPYQVFDKNDLLGLRNSTDESNPARWYIPCSIGNKTEQELVLEAFRKIPSGLYNYMKNTDYNLLWMYKGQLRRLKTNGPVSGSYTTLADLKKMAGATSTEGNGFYEGVGYYTNGKLDTNSGKYILLSASVYDSSPQKKYRELAYGLSGDVYSVVQSIIKANATGSSGQDNSRLDYVLLQVKQNESGYYTYACGTFFSPVSLSEIQGYLRNIELETSSPTISEGSSGSYTSAEKNPVTGILENTSAQIEYIKNFPNYQLKFIPGIDNRSTVSDPFKETGLAATNKVEILEEELILKIKIHPNQIGIISNNMSLSDVYYQYVNLSTLSADSVAAFFKEIDEILDLKLEQNSLTYWKNGMPPILNNGVVDKWTLIPMTACAILREDFEKIDLQKDVFMSTISSYPRIGLEEFITSAEREKYKLLFFDLKEENGEYELELSENTSLVNFLETINQYIIYKNKKSYSCNINFKQERNSLNLYSLELLEAYTRGHDFIQENYTTVRAKELQNNKRIMSYDDNYFAYKYSGRDFDIMRQGKAEDIFTFSNGVYAVPVRECDLLLETDVTLGDSYGRKKYFVEYIKYNDKDSQKYLDTFKVKDYIEATDGTKYVEEDLEIITSTIDLTQCKFYDPTAATSQNKWCDCKYNGTQNGGEYNRECVYQKLGYCPYRFTTEKHPRRIRTLAAEKSNRFNIIQKLSKVFEIYPQFYIEFDNNGRIILNDDKKMQKHVFFITEKGNLNQIGFRYEKNLKNISRTINSTALTTKLFVENIDSELSETGLCSIQTAEDNTAKTSYILDFSYYTRMNLLNTDKVVRDLYGIEKEDFAFIPTIGYYNTQYDKLTNLIVNLSGETMVQLEAENETNIQGITTSLVEKQKISQNMYQFKIASYKDQEYDYTTSDTYENYLIKMKEQSTILWGAVETLFFTGDYYNWVRQSGDQILIQSVKYMEENYLAWNDFNTMTSIYSSRFCKGELFWRLMIEGFEGESYKPPFDSWEDFKEKVVDKKLYLTNGKAGQYNDMVAQVKTWKTERAKWLNKINDISQKFYQKYEPYIKEGTWKDSNYLTDNEYYWAGVHVLSDSSQPKITYTISVIDISLQDEDYRFELADTSYVEDIDFFGISSKTGLPNKQKVLISTINYDLDNPMNNSIEVKNYTSSFDELFESISSSVQSLVFNENTYKRAANFTATKYISKDALQGTLFDGDLTLIDHYSENLVMDDNGLQGKNINNTSLGYKLDGEGLSFTKDGGQTWDIGVGPNGINADYIKFGQLDASKIQIVDGNYIYFLWDKSGLNAYRDPSTSTNGLVDFARFNKYGLSLIENNNVRLRAGYEFKNAEDNNISGNYKTEMDLVDQNIGFYLYNDSGQAIFKTETSSDYSGVEGDYSARLSLTGEMFITNKVLDGENDGSVISRISEYQYEEGMVIQPYSMPYLIEQEYLTEAMEQKHKDFDLITPYYKRNLNGDIILNDSDSGTISIEVWEFMGDPIESNTTIDYIYSPETNTVMKVNSNLYKSVILEYNMSIIEVNLEDILADDEERILSIDDIVSPLWDKATKDRRSFSAYQVSSEDDITKYYTGGTYRKNLFTSENTLATATENSSTEIETVLYFDVRNINIGDSVTEIAENLYGAILRYEGESYTHWRHRTITGNTTITSTSDISTQEVGIFINNKMGISNEVSSSYGLINEDNENEIAIYGLRSAGIDIYSDNFLVIGDSITNALEKEKFLGNNAFGIGSASLDNYNMSNFYTGDNLNEVQQLIIDKIIANGNINLAFFMGMNSSSNYNTSYQNFINHILNNSKIDKSKVSISLISIIAVDESLNNYTSTTNEKITERNSEIQTFAQEKEYLYIDIFNATKNISHADRVHPSDEGYSQLCSILKSAFETNGESTVIDNTENLDAKEAADTALSGAERIFTIALKGQNVDTGEIEYKNILSILKNGYLYMGGTINDYYGNTLDLSSFGLLPDRVRINQPQLCMSNSGLVWMNFGKIYPIGDNGVFGTEVTLLDLLNSIGNLATSGSSSGNTSNLSAGYYLIDPLGG